AQVIEILADRLRGDGKVLGKVIDQDAAIVPGHLNNFIVTLGQEHWRPPLSFLLQMMKNESEFEPASVASPGSDSAVQAGGDTGDGVEGGIHIRLRGLELPGLETYGDAAVDARLGQIDPAIVVDRT